MGRLVNLMPGQLRRLQFAPELHMKTERHFCPTRRGVTAVISIGRSNPRRNP